MARRWKRRSILIGAIIVALSVGIVFASLPYLQAPTPPHGSVASTLSHTVGPGSQSQPGFFGLQIPDVTASESFYVNVTITGGTASFCVLDYQQYANWISAGASNAPSDCTLGPTGQISQDILKFSLTPGTWVVVALNSGASEITVYFSPA